MRPLTMIRSNLLLILSCAVFKLVVSLHIPDQVNHISQQLRISFVTGNEMKVSMSFPQCTIQSHQSVSILAHAI
jgi:hypothetical protein